MKNKIDEYNELYNEYVDWLKRAEALYADPEFQEQFNNLTEEDEDFGFVYEDLYNMITEIAEI